MDSNQGSTQPISTETRAQVRFRWKNARLSLVGQQLTHVPAIESLSNSDTLDRPDTAITSPRSVEILDLHSNKLRTLEGVSQFKSLRTLIVDHNKLGDNCLDGVGSLSECFPQLETLWMNNNNIVDLPTFVSKLQLLPALGYLSLFKNPACPTGSLPDQKKHYMDYRNYVIYHLPKIHTLDAKWISSDERKRVRSLYPPGGAVPVPPKPQSNANRQESSRFVPSLGAVGGAGAHQDPTSRFHVLKEGSVLVFRNNISVENAKLMIQEQPTGLSCVSSKWIVLHERRVMFYADKANVVPEDIIYLRNTYTVDDTIQKINTYLAVILTERPLTPGVRAARDTIILLFESESEEVRAKEWQTALRKQTLPNLTSGNAQSEFTRMQAEHEQYLKDETERRLVALQARIAKVPSPSVDAQQVKLLRVLGMGAFGTVYEASWQGSIVAAKVLHEQDDEDPDCLEDFVNEVETMATIRHPRVLMMWGVSFWPRIILTERFKTNLSSMLAQMPHSTKQHDDDVGHHEEYNGSQVESREASRVGKRLSWVTRLRIARDVAASIEYLHLRRDTMIVHRDIKGGNFLVDENLRVVVADFGLSERLKRGSSTWDQRGTYKGTVMFSAPENLKGSEFNELSDVYSVALVLWSLYTGQEPWKELGEDILYDDFVSKVLWDKVRPLISPGMRSRVPEYCALLEKCWADKPSDRPSIDKVVSSLNDILRKAAFAADPIAEQFWKRYFKDRDAVTIDELIGYLQHFLRGEMPQSRASERLLRYLLLEGETQSGYATMQQFGRVVWWFGPLPDINLAHVDATTNGLTMLVNAMLNICKNPVFFGFISLHDAALLLYNQPANTFIMRFTQGRFEKSHYEFVRIGANKEIIQTPVWRKILGWNWKEAKPTERWSLSKKLEDSEPSLEGLVAAFRTANSCPATTALPSWPFIYLN